MADVAIDSAYSTRKRTHNTSKDETDSIENDRSRSKRQSTNNSTTGKKFRKKTTLGTLVSYRMYSGS